uniref:Zinc finger CCCH-type containing 18 n=1 Tax=Monopterus albus TaxID=43700 RepID=A0A3Q3JKM2_MONAL
MYADLASPVSSASSRSPTPNHPRKHRGVAQDRPPHGRDKNRDKGSRKRYLPSDKDRPGSPLSKRMAIIPGRPPLSPRMERPRGQGPRPVLPQGDRKRPLSPPPKSSGKGPATPSGKPAGPGPASATGSGSSSGSGSNKPSNTLSRREELLKQLKAVEDAIARKRAKIPAK